MESLEQKVRDRTQELETLYRVTAVASESLDLDSTLLRSLNEVLTSMSCSTGAIHLVEEESKALSLVIQQGLSAHILKELEPSSSAPGLAGRVHAQDAPLVFTEMEVFSDGTDAQSAVPDIMSYVGVPIHARGRGPGVLSVFVEPEIYFGAEDVALLSSVADQIGVAVDNATLVKKDEQVAIMEERQRLARELHDAVTQTLYSVTLFAETSRLLAKTEDSDLLEKKLSELNEIALDALKEMRLLVYNLRPSVLEKVGLVEALQQRLDSVEKRVNMKTQLQTNAPFKLPATIEVDLYRIAEEVLNNILKHSGAEHVLVEVYADKHAVKLSIKDDGKGFDLEEALLGGGMGLKSMIERVEKMGGTLETRTSPGEGVQTMVRIPIEETGKTAGEKEIF